MRQWSGASAKRNPALMLDQASVPWFAELNRSLTDRLDEAAFRARIKLAARRLRALAGEMLARGLSEYPALDGRALQAGIDAAGGAVDFGHAMLFPAISAAPVPALAG